MRVCVVSCCETSVWFPIDTVADAKIYKAMLCTFKRCEISETNSVFQQFALHVLNILIEFRSKLLKLSDEFDSLEVVEQDDPVW